MAWTNISPWFYPFARAHSEMRIQLENFMCALPASVNFTSANDPFLAIRGPTTFWVRRIRQQGAGMLGYTGVATFWGTEWYPL